MTVEAAIALSSIIIVVVLCVGAVAAVVDTVRCIDAAREAARLAARGDAGSAVTAAQRVGPRGARVTLREEGSVVVAVVWAPSPVPWVSVSAEAVAVTEPGEVG